MESKNEKMKQRAEEISAGEQRIEFEKAAKEESPPAGGEKKEILTQEEEAIKEELKREISAMELDENLKKEAEDKARKIGALDEEKKLKHLLEIAKNKGVLFAIKIAEEMKDPYILDTFHDLLVREGLYKNFVK